MLLPDRTVLREHRNYGQVAAPGGTTLGAAPRVVDAVRCGGGGDGEQCPPPCTAVTETFVSYNQIGKMNTISILLGWKLNRTRVLASALWFLYMRCRCHGTLSLAALAGKAAFSPFRPDAASQVD